MWGEAYRDYFEPILDGGPSNLALKVWVPSFDPCNEPSSIQQIWVILPGLALNFWSHSYPTGIGNSIGHIIVLLRSSGIIRCMCKSWIIGLYPSSVQCAIK